MRCATASASGRRTSPSGGTSASFASRGSRPTRRHTFTETRCTCSRASRTRSGVTTELARLGANLDRPGRLPLARDRPGDLHANGAAPGRADASGRRRRPSEELRAAALARDPRVRRRSRHGRRDAPLVGQRESRTSERVSACRLRGAELELVHRAPDGRTLNLFDVSDGDRFEVAFTSKRAGDDSTLDARYHVAHTRDGRWDVEEVVAAGGIFGYIHAGFYVGGMAFPARDERRERLPLARGARCLAPRAVGPGSLRLLDTDTRFRPVGEAHRAARGRSATRRRSSRSSRSRSSAMTTDYMETLSHLVGGVQFERCSLGKKPRVRNRRLRRRGDGHLPRRRATAGGPCGRRPRPRRRARAARRVDVRRDEPCLSRSPPGRPGGRRRLRRPSASPPRACGRGRALGRQARARREADGPRRRGDPFARPARSGGRAARSPRCSS